MQYKMTELRAKLAVGEKFIALKTQGTFRLPAEGHSALSQLLDGMNAGPCKLKPAGL